MTKNFYKGFTKLFLSVLLVSGFSAFGQTIVYSDNFNTDLAPIIVSAGSTLANPVNGLSYSTATTATEAPDCKLNGGPTPTPTNQLLVSPKGSTAAQSGATTVSGLLSSFTAPFNTKLSSNAGLVSWTFNTRNSRTKGMTALENAFQTEASSTAMATVLVASDASAAIAGSTTKGWAVVVSAGSIFENSNKISLGYFTSGLNGVLLFTPILSTGDFAIATYFNIKVTYDPSNNNWKLYVTSGSSWVNPRTTEPALIGSKIDATNTTVTMSHFMFLYNHTASNVSQWDNFAVTVDATIPVELVSFDAKRSNKSTLLTWKTASEKENAAFNIEQSTNGTDFQTIGQVKGNGTTNSAHTYNFEHNTPSVGINYYRLKQVDFNGKFENSSVRSVVFGKSGLVIKTTLVSNVLDIVVSDETAIPLSIFNTAGQEVFTAKVQGAQRLNINALPAGTYIVRTAAGDVERFVKQ